MKKIVVLYHKGCRDGFGAAWSAWKKFGTKAEYIGVNHDDPLPDGLKGKEIYTLDFSYPLDKTRALLKLSKLLTTIDHHISAEQSTKLAHNYVYELHSSGAVLSWKYFHPNIKVPEFLKYIEDIDIWRLSMSKTMELMASLDTYKMEFPLWNRLAKDWEKTITRKKYLEEGMAIIKYQEILVKKAVKDSEEVVFMGKKALVSNFTLALNSQIGDAMRKKGYSLGIIWQKRGDKLIVSLRSAGKVDASKIAAKFGGGGHKRAAAFRLQSKEKFPWEKTKK